MTPNERMRELRKALGLTTSSFAKCMGLSQSGISNIESGQRSVTDKHIKLICVAYPQVNGDWIRSGEGEMFLHTAHCDEISSLCERYGLGEFVASMLRSYVTLDDHHKQMILDWLTAWCDDFMRAKRVPGGDGQTAGQLPDHLDNGEVDHQIAQSERLHDLLDKSTRSGA